MQIDCILQDKLCNFYFVRFACFFLHFKLFCENDGTEECVPR